MDSVNTANFEKLEKQSRDDASPAQKVHGGLRKGAGRKPGVPNKISGDIKAMIVEALLREGGVQYLQRVASEDMKAFCSLIGRALPLTVQGDDNGGPIRITWGNE